VTVAAVVLAASAGDTLREVGGVAAIRRIADIAWAGGALPIVIVPEGPDSATDLESPLSGAAGAVIGDPAADRPPLERVSMGLATAHAEVDGTDAALVWPGRYVHVDAETVTSLIETHGLDRSVVLVPSYEGTPGWPILLPLGASEALARMGDAPLADLASALRGAGVATRLVELGDPGITHDLATASDALPDFVGPAEPVGRAQDWGERVPSADPSPARPRGAR
jgi:CTP:molybdopterin cytidylyltransferase MocA